MKIVKIPIEMIASFSKKGIPHPLKFKISASGDKYPTIVKVNTVIHVESEKTAGNPIYVFRCQSLIEDNLKVYELKYELSTCKWFVYKI